MPRFKIHIISDDNAVAAAKALDNAGIPHIGPCFAKFTESEGGWTVGEEMTAIIDAPDEAAAGRRIRRIVGPEPDVEAKPPVGETSGPGAKF